MTTFLDAKTNRINPKNCSESVLDEKPVPKKSEKFQIFLPRSNFLYLAG